MASAHIAHNQMEIPLGMGFLIRLPVDFYWFADGLAITGATAEYSNLLGARIRSIGGKTPEQFLADLAPYVSSENETWLRFKSIDLMPARGVLLHFGMIGADGKVPLQVETTHGETLSVALPLALGNIPKIGIAEGLHVPPVLYRSHPNSWYWSQYLSDSQTLFIQYNQCINNSQPRFGDVAKQALAEADSHPVKRVVIDLRWNGGGDSSVINPLKNGLASRLRALGHLYVLTGPGTFSSAVVNAVSLRQDLSATLVGETAGGTPDGYGEVDRLTLPNSKLVVRFTTKRWGPKTSEVPASLTPDLPVPFKLADFIAGRDPALDAAIAARP